MEVIIMIMITTSFSTIYSKLLFTYEQYFRRFF